MYIVARNPKPCVSLPSTPVCAPPKNKKMSTAEEEASPLKTVLNGGGQGKRKKLYTFPTREVAEEMALLDAGLLRLIKPSELEQGAWMKRDKDQRAPNIMAMVKSFNKMALLVPTEILEEEMPQARAKVITAYIKIAQACHSHGNYNSLKAILAGLQSTPIFRLARTWKEVGARKRRKFQELTTLMHQDNNWSAYRQEISKKLKENTHFVPFLGIFLTTTAYSQTAAIVFDTRVDSSKERLSSSNAMEEAKKRRMSTESMYATYHLLEPITVREKLQSLRRTSMNLNAELPSASHTLDCDESVRDRSPRCSSPIPLGGHISLSNGTTATDKQDACGSCDEKAPVSQLCRVTSNGVESPCGSHAQRGSTSDSDCDRVEPESESESVPLVYRKFQHSSSDGNILECRLRVKRDPMCCAGSESFSTENISRRESYECALNFSSDSHDECDINGDIEYFSDNRTVKDMVITVPVRDGTPTKMVHKKVGVPRGPSKKAKFLALLKGRYRHAVSSPTIDSGEIMYDQCGNDSGEQATVLNGSRDLDSEKTNNFLNSGGETLSLTITNEKVVSTPSHSDVEGDRSQSGVTKRSSKGSDMDLPPGSLQRGRVLSGSLEGLLSAINAELPSTRENKSRMGWRTGCKGKGEGIIRSPSLLGLKSFDVGDGADMGSGISLTASFSSPSLDSFLDLGSSETEAAPNLTPVHRRPKLVAVLDHSKREEACVSGSAEPDGVLESTELGRPCGSAQVWREGVTGGIQRDLHKVVQSRSSSNSSMESTEEGYRPQPAIPNRLLRVHRRNSSDPNILLNKSTKKSNDKNKLPSPQPNKSFPSKHSSPLIDVFKQTAFHRRQSSIARRKGHCVDHVSRNLWSTKNKELMSPQELLHNYQFISLGCCYLIESRTHLRQLLTISHHNTEAVNYKLSYSREPA